MVAIALVTNVPKFLEFEVSERNKSIALRTTSFAEKDQYMLFMSYFELASTGLVPLIALCFYNCAICARIRKSARFAIKKAHKKRGRKEPKERTTTETTNRGESEATSVEGDRLLLNFCSAHFYPVYIQQAPLVAMFFSASYDAVLTLKEAKTFCYN